MNDNTKVLDQNPVSAPVSNNVVQPTGSMLKEQAPMEQNLSEFVRPAGPEAVPSLPQEVSESGVEVNRDHPDLTFEHKQIGLEHSGATAPVPSVPTGLVQISQEKDINSSGTWLNALIEKVEKIMRLMGV